MGTAKPVPQAFSTTVSVSSSTVSCREPILEVKEASTFRSAKCELFPVENLPPSLTRRSLSLATTCCLLQLRWSQVPSLSLSSNCQGMPLKFGTKSLKRIGDHATVKEISPFKSLEVYSKCHETQAGLKFLWRWCWCRQSKARGIVLHGCRVWSRDRRGDRIMWQLQLVDTRAAPAGGRLQEQSMTMWN